MIDDAQAASTLRGHIGEREMTVSWLPEVPVNDPHHADHGRVRVGAAHMGPGYETTRTLFRESLSSASSGMPRPEHVVPCPHAWIRNSAQNSVRKTIVFTS